MMLFPVNHHMDVCIYIYPNSLFSQARRALRGKTLLDRLLLFLLLLPFLSHLGHLKEQILGAMQSLLGISHLLLILLLQLVPAQVTQPKHATDYLSVARHVLF